jgi:FkbM family methyltransferase
LENKKNYLMKQFSSDLKNKIRNSIYNNYGQENFDEFRFGIYPRTKRKFVDEIKFLIKKTIGYKKNYITDKVLGKLEKVEELNWFYNNLSDPDKVLLIEIIAYRLLGYKKIKLSINNLAYRQELKKAESLANYNDMIESKFMHFKLYKMNLTPIGKNIQFYFSPLGVAIDYLLEQYAYKQNGQVVVQAESGDTVLDIGGCWGDTALYFANKVGEKGKVYSFEFIPENINLFYKNIGLNPKHAAHIELIKQPVSDKSGQIVYFKDNGPGSQIKIDPFAEQTGSTSTLSIDDFVEKFSIDKVDFIKMDIEGAEPIALKGAINTIKKYRPKLAIAIYHSMSDFVNIPRWIHDLNLDYELHLAHYTIHEEETVIFANPRK